jgi:hypothetical protein
MNSAERPPIQGFEAIFLERLDQLVRALPKGAADLYVGKHPSHTKSVFPYFCITPTNPRSAKVQGFVYEGQGIDFTIGQGTGGEVFVSREKTERQNANLERFLRMCEAVFTTSFNETLVCSRRGRVIWSRIELSLDGLTVRIGGRQVFWWLFPGRTTKQFLYEPYC